MRKSEAEAIARLEQRKKRTDILRSVLFSTCGFYTLISMIILASQLFSQRDMIDPMRFFLILPFSACIALANLIFKTGLKIFPKLLIHCSAVVLSFYVFMCSSEKELNVLVLIILLAVAYAVIAAVVLIIIKAKKKKSEPKPEYVSMFSSTKKSK